MTVNILLQVKALYDIYLYKKIFHCLDQFIFFVYSNSHLSLNPQYLDNSVDPDEMPWKVSLGSGIKKNMYSIIF